MRLTKIVQKCRKVGNSLVQTSIESALLPSERHNFALQSSLTVSELPMLFGRHHNAGELLQFFKDSMMKVAGRRSSIKIALS